MNKRATVSSNDTETVDFVTFVESFLIDWKTGNPFVLTQVEKAFVRHAFQRKANGRFKYPELVFSAPKKTGKSAFAAMIVLYVIYVLGGKFAEAIICANDEDQSVDRVFTACVRIVRGSSIFEGDLDITQNRITFRSTGSTITAISSDYAGAAGADPMIVVFDELWGYTSERLHRLWDEMVPPPTQKLACRLTVSYAGFEGESTLLESLYKRGKALPKIGPDLRAGNNMLFFWTHRLTSPWQHDDWLAEMRATMRPNAFLRQIENRWVSTETSFVEMAWWDQCVDHALRPLLTDTALPVWVGLDASVKHDSTAIVVCAWDRKLNKVRLIWHRVFQPSKREPLDFEATVEQTMLDLRKRFRLRQVWFDPFQMAAVAQRLTKAGVPMEEYPQTSANLTAASQNVYERIKDGSLIVYPDDAMRLAVQRSVAIETPRGWRLAKDKTSHKIDVVVVLSFAALAAVEGGIRRTPMRIAAEVVARASQPTAYTARYGRRPLTPLQANPFEMTVTYSPRGVSAMSGPRAPRQMPGEGMSGPYSPIVP